MTKPRWKLTQAFAALALLAAVAAPSRLAHAQEPDGSAILPVFAEGVDPTSLANLAEDIDAIADALAETGSSPPISTTVLRMRLLAYGRFPSEVTSAEKQEFESLARGALIAVARLQSQGALADAKLVADARSAISLAMSFAKERLESLNRDNALASKVMDTCLLTPRLMLAQGESEQLVVLECLECQRLVPGVTPARNAHPPEVQAAFAKAVQAITTSRTSPSVLDVATTDGCEDCILRLNGRKIGETPFAGSMVSGSYAVQVEYPGQAPETALVHQVTLTAPDTTRVRIEPFERSLRQSGQHIYLDERAQRNPTSSKGLARSLGVSLLVLLRAQYGQKVSLEAIHSDNNARSCYEEGSREEVRQLAAKLAQCSQGATAEAQARGQAVGSQRSATSSSFDSPGHAQRRTQRNWGLALMSLGAASVGAASIVLRTPVWQDPDRSVPAASERGFHALAVLGGVMAIASEPLWAPAKSKHAPWWTWAAMLVGTLPVTYGIYAWSIDGDCTFDGRTPVGCVLEYRTKLRGSTYLAQGLPLLTLPAAHYVARRLRSQSSVASLSVGVSAGGQNRPDGTQQTQLFVRGTF